MEWVEVTGKTLDEAKEHALDQLGVAEGDAEIVVLGEPKAGLFGRMRGEARVRARVRPVGPRPRRTRRPRDRDRERSGQGGGRQGGQGGQGGRNKSTSSSGGRQNGRPSDGGGQPKDGAEGDADNALVGAAASGGGNGEARSPRRRGGRGRGGRGSSSGGSSNGATTGNGGAHGNRGGTAGDNGSGKTGAQRNPESEGEMAEGMTLEEQGEIARGFIAGLVAELGIEAAVEVRILDEETVEVSATGDELGILVGPRGSTLAALQDVTRTVVQRHCPSRTDRILVDVADYRQKRAAALQRFTQQIAGEVVESGSERALEPMSPADRKVVHDAANLLDGVVTRSEGEDPKRYVVIVPAS